MQVSAQVHVTNAIAESFPSRPDRVVECRNAAEEEMTRLAAERRRHLATLPELSEVRDTKLGLVELTFVADTEAD